MNKYIDLTGQKFGKLNVIQYSGKNLNGRTSFECQCECGNKIITTSDHLKSGDTKSCGCLKKQAIPVVIQKRYQKYLNKTFGKLTIIEILVERNSCNHYECLCKCECGNISRPEITAILRGLTISCGCWKPNLRKGENHPFWKSEKTQEARNAERLHRKDHDYRYKKWSKLIKEKYDYTCQVCNKRGGILRSHHLNSWIEYPKERYLIENGICLCKQCHDKFHASVGGFSQITTKEDFTKWYEAQK